MAECYKLRWQPAAFCTYITVDITVKHIEFTINFFLFESIHSEYAVKNKELKVESF